MSKSQLTLLFPQIYEEKEASINTLPDFLKEALEADQQTIPKILHFIWLGKKEIRQSFKDNMIHFAHIMRQRGGRVVFWYDEEHIVFRETWTKEADITKVDVKSVFSNQENMPTFEYFRSSLNTVPPNYGIAGDLLRHEIIEKFGGYYFDCDIEEEFVDLEKFIEAGEKSPYQLVCGYYEYPRNDLYGCKSNSSFSRYLNDLILKNFQNPNLKNDIGYFRPFLNYTILLAGPDPFVKSVEALFLNPQAFGFNFDKSVEEMTSDILFNVNIRSTSLTWTHRVQDRQQVIFESDQERRYRIQHDLLKSLAFENRILDLEKYSQYLKQGEELFLIKTIEALIKTDPQIFAKVDRIFVSNLEMYLHLKKLLQDTFNTITWNELAVLKFASMMQARALTNYLINEQKINPYNHELADVGYYDCAEASPFSIALETGNLKIIRLMLDAAKDDAEIHAALQVPEINLIYAGPRYYNKMKVYQILDLKLDTLYEKLKDLSPKSHGFEKYDFDRQNYLAIKKLIQPYV